MTTLTPGTSVPQIPTLGRQEADGSPHTVCPRCGSTRVYGNGLNATELACPDCGMQYEPCPPPENKDDYTLHFHCDTCGADIWAIPKDFYGSCFLCGSENVRVLEGQADDAEKPDMFTCRACGSDDTFTYSDDEGLGGETTRLQCVDCGEDYVLWTAPSRDLSLKICPVCNTVGDFSRVYRNRAMCRECKTIHPISSLLEIDYTPVCSYCGKEGVTQDVYPNRNYCPHCQEINVAIIPRHVYNLTKNDPKTETTETTFGDIALGETFVMDGAYWQRIAVTSPPTDTQLTYYFTANAALYRPAPGQLARAFQVEYIHLLDASIVERVYTGEERIALTEKGFHSVGGR